MLTETDNPGALKWLKKNDEIGMPVAIIDVVDKVAELRQSTSAQVKQLIHANFASMIKDDPWLEDVRAALSC